MIEEHLYHICNKLFVLLIICSVIAYQLYRIANTFEDIKDYFKKKEL